MTPIGNRRPNSENVPYTRIVCVVADQRVQQRVERAVADDMTSVMIMHAWTELECFESIPDVLVLDSRVADVATMRSLMRLRRRWPGIDIAILEVQNEAMASQLLDWGADDAIESSCSARHVTARLGAAARRARTENASLRRRIGDVVYDRDSRRVWCDGEEVAFAPRELAVLDCLWRRAGEVVAHDTLHDFVWSGDDKATRANRVEVYISYVRRKLARSNQVAIETLRGHGYRLVRMADMIAKGG
jgi:DNA-binding response OmpR family regulator